MGWLAWLAAVVAGIGNPVQSAAGARLHEGMGSTALAALVVYAVALLGLLLLSPFLGLSFRDLGPRLAGLPWWAWVGGLCNLAFVLAGMLATRPLGAGTFTVITACLAVVASILLDRFGLMGLEPRPLSAMRLLGAAMAIGAIVLVARS
ncbi:DMT family transporter [Roseomonas populi]|uniref:DMT family transporter n=1 Tax=Roseomonas populi TaxID=3121582 RepID=A0ABT1X9M7_9PROT|nr:DMT family transporter [Roseomonas pecuniae]MCR0984466.1 DMT family transporter [Roseomonas pecuniae]